MRKLDYKEFGTGKEQSGLYIRLTETAREGKCRGRSLSLSLASLPTRQARCYGLYLKWSSPRDHADTIFPPSTRSFNECHSLLIILNNSV
ncbi:hypothetical protein J6590_050149 [Homalodisca vitripennis]|nr:hypothetical protein J6590_050149 [Homalodisca vitripennis]